MEAEALIAGAVAALQSGDRDGAAALVGQLVASEARLGKRWAAIGRMAAAIGEIDLADRAMRLGARDVPADVDATLGHAALLADAGRAEAALEVLRPLNRAASPLPQIAHLMASLYSQLGEFDVARTLFERALAAWPLSGHSWLGLASLHHYGPDDPELERLREQRRAMEGAVPDARAAYLYALGKALDDAGAADEAFGAFAEGAALIRGTQPYDRVSSEDQVQALITGFGTDTLASLVTAPGVDTSRPIFVTGVPRSGTTLVEQMLTAHAEVGEGGEINIFPYVVRRIGGADSAAARRFVAASGGAAAAWRDAAKLYLHLLRQRLPKAGRAVDKSLNNSRFLGLIGLALPDAPLVWVRRDPLDTAWSCFRTMFSRGVNWSWSLDDIAHHMRLEERLLDHWSQVFGGRLLVVDYEKLVTAPEAEAARILAHCGLPPQSLEGFEQTRRVVATSSLAQVRKAVYRSSVGAAEPYRKHLKPFVASYRL